MTVADGASGRVQGQVLLAMQDLAVVVGRILLSSQLP
jgi:hypothetical protein